MSIRQAGDAKPNPDFITADAVTVRPLQQGESDL